MKKSNTYFVHYVFGDFYEKEGTPIIAMSHDQAAEIYAFGQALKYDPKYCRAEFEIEVINAGYRIKKRYPVRIVKKHYYAYKVADLKPTL
jgi:hypothetical protein